MIFNELKIIFSFIFFNLYFVFFGLIFGNENGAIIGLIVSIILTLIIIFFSDKIILKLHKGKLIKNTQINLILKKCSKESKIKTPKLYLIKSKSPTILTTGRNIKKSSIGISKELLLVLTEKELKSLFFHEIYHIKKKESFLQTINIFIITLIFFFSGLFVISSILNFSNNFGKNSKIYFLSLFILFFIPILLFIKITTSKKREYNADKYSIIKSNSSKYLISSLKKLEFYSNNSKARIQDNFFTSIYILNPFRNNFFDLIFSTHPKTNQRINKLKYYL